MVDPVKLYDLPEGFAIADETPEEERLFDLPEGFALADDMVPRMTGERLFGAFTEGLKDLVRAPHQLAKGASIWKFGEESGLTWAINEAIKSPILTPDPEYTGKSSGWIEDFVRMAPQMGSQLFAGGLGFALGGPVGAAVGLKAATGGMIGAGIASTAFMGPQIAGQTYESLTNQGVENERAMWAGLANAAMQTPLEFIGISRFSKLWKPQLDLVKRMKQIGEVMGVEWLTEFLQAYPDLGVNIWALNPDKDILEKGQAFLDEAWEATKQGAYEGTLTAPWALLGLGGPQGDIESKLPPPVKTPVETISPLLARENALRDALVSGPGPGRTENIINALQWEEVGRRAEGLIPGEFPTPYTPRVERGLALRPEDEIIYEGAGKLRRIIEHPFTGDIGGIEGLGEAEDYIDAERYIPPERGGLVGSIPPTAPPTEVKPSRVVTEMPVPERPTPLQRLRGALYGKPYRVREEEPTVEPETEVAEEKPDIETAYNELKKEMGMSWVNIADLRDRAGITQDEIEKILKTDKRFGTATGDVSFATEHQKSGAIYYEGRKDPALLVRMKDVARETLESEAEVEESEWDTEITDEQSMQLKRIREAFKKENIPFHPFKITAKGYEKWVFVKNSKNNKTVVIKPDGTGAPMDEKMMATIMPFILDGRTKPVRLLEDIKAEIEFEKKAKKEAEKRQREAKKLKEGIYEGHPNLQRYKHEDGKWYRWDGISKWILHKKKKGYPSAMELNEDREMGRLKRISGLTEVEEPTKETWQPLKTDIPGETIRDRLGGKKSAKFGTMLDTETGQTITLVLQPDTSSLGEYSVLMKLGKRSNTVRMYYKAKKDLADAMGHFEWYMNTDNPGRFKVTIEPKREKPIKPVEDTDKIKLQRLKAKRFKTANDELMIKILEARIKADPSKWKVGDGVGWRVGIGKGSQINRGFRIKDVAPEEKLALVTQVADTGLTVTGGIDRIGDEWIHIADLVRDRKYDKREIQKIEIKEEKEQPGLVRIEKINKTIQFTEYTDLSKEDYSKKSTPQLRKISKKMGLVPEGNKKQLLRYINEKKANAIEVVYEKKGGEKESHVVDKGAVQRWPVGIAKEGKHILAPNTEKGAVKNLLLKTKDGTIYESAPDVTPVHGIMLDEFNLNAEDVVDTGIVDKGGKALWGRGKKGIVKFEAEEREAAIAQKRKEIDTKEIEKARKASNFREWVKLTGGVNFNDKTWKGGLSDLRWDRGPTGKRKLAKGFPVGFWRSTGLGINERVTDAIESGWLPEGADEQAFMDAIENNPTQKVTEILDNLEENQVTLELERRYGRKDFENDEQFRADREAHEAEIQKEIEDEARSVAEEEKYAQLEREAIETEAQEVIEDDFDWATGEVKTKEEPTPEPTEAEKLETRIRDLKQEAYDEAAKVAEPWSEPFKKRYQLEIKRRQKNIAALEKQLEDLGRKIAEPEEGELFGKAKEPESLDLFEKPETMLSLAAYGAEEGESVLTSEQKDAVERNLKGRKDKARIKKNLKKFKGTPWEKQATEGLLVNQAINDLLAGKWINYESALDRARSGPRIIALIKEKGEEGIWEYIEKSTGKDGLIGHPEKPGNSVNGSMVNCHPSKWCATGCYARASNYAFPDPIVDGEISDWAINNNPERAANIIERFYSGMLEKTHSKALRFNDKGDLSPGHVATIKALNKKGVRVQCFSKREDLLSQVPAENVRLLSIDRTNKPMAKRNPELGIAFVYQDIKDVPFLEKQKKRFKDHGGVILPENKFRGFGKERMPPKEDLEAIPEWGEDYTCPVDAGVVHIKSKAHPEGNWHCTMCDRHGQPGCFFGQSTTKLSSVEIPLNERGNIDDAIKELKDLNETLSGESREKLSQELDNFIRKVRSNINPERTEEVQRGAERAYETIGTGQFEEGTEETTLLAIPDQPYTFTKRELKNVKNAAKIIVSVMRNSGLDQKVIDRIKIDLKPIIDLRGKNIERSLREHAIEGKVDIKRILASTTIIDEMNAIIEFALKGTNSKELEETAIHETFHIIWAMMPEADRKVLLRHFKTREGVSDGYIEYVKRQSKFIKALPGSVRRALMKIKALFSRIRNALNGKGFRTPEDIFGKAMAGAYKGRFRGVGMPSTYMQKQLLSEEAKTANFAKYMKGSVVTKTGKPWEKPGDELVVYHGTDMPVGEFDLSWADISPKHASSSLGFFFSTRTDTAGAYAGWYGKYGGNIIPAYLAIKKPYTMPLPEIMDIDTRKEGKALREKLIKQGYDGIMVEGYPTTEIIAFHPTQIKSIFNIGTWSPETGDISFQLHGWHGKTTPGPLKGGKFTPEMVGSGAGLALGWGVYISEEEGVGRFYAEVGGRSQEQRFGDLSGEMTLEIVNDVTEDLVNLGVDFSDADVMTEIDNTVFEGKNKKLQDETVKKILDNKELFPRPERRLYQVTLGKDLDEFEWLRWDEPINDEFADTLSTELPKFLRKKFPDNENFRKAAIKKIWRDSEFSEDPENIIGSEIYRRIENSIGSARETSEFLNSIGIEGNKAPVGYFGGGGRGITEGKFNYVIFDPSKIEITQETMFQVKEESPLLTKAQELDTQFLAGSLVSIRDLRKEFPKMSKKEFDEELLSLADDQRIWLHTHAFPKMAKPEEIVRDAEGNVYMGLSHRVAPETMLQAKKGKIYESKELAKAKEKVGNLETDKLESYIEKRYEAKAPQEELGALETLYAERVSEESPGFLDEIEDEQIEEYDLQTVLAGTYDDYISGRAKTALMDRNDIIANMRANIERFGGKTENVSDEEIFEAAKDLWEARNELLGRIKRKPETMLRAVDEDVTEESQHLGAKPNLLKKAKIELDSTFQAIKESKIPKGGFWNNLLSTMEWGDHPVEEEVFQATKDRESRKNEVFYDIDHDKKTDKNLWEILKSFKDKGKPFYQRIRSADLYDRENPNISEDYRKIWDAIDYMDINQIQWFDEERQALKEFAFRNLKNEMSFSFLDPNIFDEKGMGNSNFKTAHSQYGIKAEGIRFIIGKIDGKVRVQSIRFKKDNWTESQARDWWKDNKKEFVELKKGYRSTLEKKGVSNDILEAIDIFRRSMDEALYFMRARLKEVIDAYETTGIKMPKLGTYTDEKGKEKPFTLHDAYHEMGQHKGYYAPRIREMGDWAILSQGPEGDFFRYHAPSNRKAIKLMNYLKAEGHKNIKKLNPGVEGNKQLPESMYQNITVGEVSKALDHSIDQMKDIDPELLDKLRIEIIQAAADMMKARAFRAHRIGRRTGKGKGVVRGYIEDPLTRHMLYSNRIAGGIAKGEAAMKMFKAIQGEPKEFTREADQWVLRDKNGVIIEVRELTEKDIEKANKTKTITAGGIKAGGPESLLYEKLVKYMEDQLRNFDRYDRMVGIGKSIVSMKFLGFNLRGATVNTTAMLTTAPPAIFQYALGGKMEEVTKKTKSGKIVITKPAKFRSIMLALGKAGKDYVRVMRGHELRNAEEQAFMDSIAEKGYDRPQYMHDALGAIKDMQGKMWGNLMELSMKPFGLTEQWNRGSTMLAAFRLLRKKGVDVEKAKELALLASDRAHGVYGRATLPMMGWGTSPLAKIVQMGYTYQKFPHNYLQMLYDLGFKKKDVKAMTFALAAPLVVGGAKSSIAVTMVLGIVKAIMVLLGDDREPEKMVYDTIRSEFGDRAERVARFGAFGAVGVDLSGSLAVGMEVPKTLMDMTGPFGGVYEDITQSIHYIRTDQPYRSIEIMTPNVMSNIMRAVRETEGAVTRSGRRVWDEKGKPYIPSVSETIRRGLGFRPTERATIESRQWETKREYANFKKRRDRIYEKFRVYTVTRNINLLKDILKEISEYNNKVLKSGRRRIVPLISRQSMKNQLRRMQKPTKRQMGYLYTP